MKANALSITYRKISELKPPPNDARVHPPKQRKKAKELLGHYGQVIPVLVGPNDEVLEGNLIVQTMRELGYDEVATVRAPSLDPHALHALRLALNRLAEEAKWDSAKLRAEFQALLDVDFDLSVTGFDQVEIDMTFSVDEASSAAVEEAPPEPDPDAPVISRLGDMWLCGTDKASDLHRVICGDARSREVLAKLRGKLMAQTMFTDPPYNVDIPRNVSGLGAVCHRDFAMASGEMNDEEFIAFLLAFLEAGQDALVDGAVSFVCMDWRHLRHLFEATRRAGLTPLNLCVWAKTNAGMGTFYRSQHEMVLALKKGTAPHINNFELGKKGRSRSNLWTYRGMNVVGRERDELLKLHPTVKPVALVADAIKDVSHRGAIVLDPFLGSGTTLIAAHETGRRCFGVEYDPAYVDLIVRRWLDHTGGTAIHAETGETFQQREGKVLSAADAGMPGPCNAEQEG